MILFMTFRLFFLFFLLFNLLQRTFASLLVLLPPEIKFKIFDYASSNAIDYDSILSYRLVDSISQEEAKEYLEYCFQKRYKDFPWLYEHDKNFDKDFYPTFLEIILSNQKIENIKESKEKISTEDSDDKEFYKALKEDPFCKSYFFIDSTEQELKSFKTFKWIKWIKSFLSTYPCKKHFLRDMITSSLQGHLKAEIGRELVIYYSKIEQNAIFNLFTEFFVFQHRSTHKLFNNRSICELFNFSIKNNYSNDQQYVFIYVKEFFLRQFGLKKLKKYDFDLINNSKEEQEYIWNILQQSIVDENIKNLSSVLYKSLTVETKGKKQKISELQFLDLFLEPNENKIKKIMPNIGEILLSNEDDYRKLFFKLYKIQQIPIHQYCFLIQEIATLVQKKNKKHYKFKNIINDLIKSNKQLTNINFKEYFRNLFQLCESKEEKLLKNIAYGL